MTEPIEVLFRARTRLGLAQATMYLTATRGKCSTLFAKCSSDAFDYQYVVLLLYQLVLSIARE